jgi:hypothetical protein
MRFKIQCTNVMPNASIWQYTVGDTLCRQNSAELEIDFWQTGWLATVARRRGSEKLHWKSGPFALPGLRKLEPVRVRLPLDADSSRFEILLYVSV